MGLIDWKHDDSKLKRLNSAGDGWDDIPLSGNKWHSIGLKRNIVWRGDLYMTAGQDGIAKKISLRWPSFKVDLCMISLQ